MEASCHKHIIDLHVFIEDWLNGSIEKTKTNYRQFTDVLSEDFLIISPGGDSQNKTDIAKGLWGAHGVRPASFKISVRNIQTRLISNNFCVLNYEEWQIDKETTARISTVIFQKPDSSQKIQWLHLHETWRTN